MMVRKINNQNATFYTIDYIPPECAFCKKEPIGLLEVKRYLSTRRKWICTECRHKWEKGELFV